MYDRKAVVRAAPRGTTSVVRPWTYVLALAVGGALGALVLLDPDLPALAAAILAALALLFASPLRPIRLLYGLVVLVPLTAAMPRGQLVPLAVPNELLLVTVLALALVWALLRREAKPVPDGAWLAIAVFALGTSLVPLLAYMARDVALTTQEVMNLLAPLQYPLLFWIFAAVPGGTRERRTVLQLMIGTGSVVAAVGLLQAFGVGPVVSVLNEWYPSGHTAAAHEFARTTSVLAAWNALGLFLLTVLLLVAAVYPDEERRWARTNMQVATVLALLCLMATNLYSGMIGVVAGFLLIKRLDPRGLRAVVPVVVVAAVGVAVLLPDLLQRADYQARDESWLPQTLVFRWSVWERYYFGPIAESPVWGVRPSFDHLGFASPESQYVYYLFRSGAVSLAAHLAFLALVVGWMVRRLRAGGPASGPRHVGRSDLGRSLAVVVLALVAVYSLIGFINPVFTYTASVSYFWILLALVANERSDERDDDLPA